MTARKPTRAKHLGIDDEGYATLLEAQGGHCALCPATPKTRRLNVDHDHATGAVRGLLCHRCNRSLPAWMRSAWLRNAADYLDEHAIRREPPYVEETYVSLFEREQQRNADRKEPQ